MLLKTHVVTLSEIRAGESAVVLDFFNGNGIAGRLTSLGFTPGVEVQMTQNFGRGPLIVTVRGTRVALGRGEAAKICVEQRFE
jgi:ferrous iron transport protein A